MPSLFREVRPSRFTPLIVKGYQRHHAVQSTTYPPNSWSHTPAASSTEKFARTSSHVFLMVNHQLTVLNSGSCGFRVRMKRKMSISAHGGFLTSYIHWYVYCMKLRVSTKRLVLKPCSPNGDLEGALQWLSKPPILRIFQTPSPTPNSTCAWF